MPESFLADREILYLIKSSTCEACAAAEPELAAFERKHPLTQIIRIDAEGPLPARLGMKVKATPTYAFRRGNEAVLHVGALRAKDLEAWLKKLGARL